MNYLRDLWQELKSEYLSQVEEALKASGQTELKEMLDDLDAHLERKYMDLTLEEKSLERFQKIIAQMGPASDYVELLKTSGSETSAKSKTGPKEDIKQSEQPNARMPKPAEPVARKVVIVPIESQYDDPTRLTKAKWLGVGILAAAAIAIVVWKNPYSQQKKIETAPQPVLQTEAHAAAKQKNENAEDKKNSELEYRTYIVKFTTASEVNAISARELLALFNANQPPQIKTHDYKTEVRDNMLVGFICVDSKNDLDATTAMLLSSNNLKFLSIDPGTEENLRNLYAMGQPSLSARPIVPPTLAPATAPSVPVAENKNAVTAATLVPATENTNTAETQKIQPKQSGPPVIFMAKAGIGGIAIGKPGCNMRYVKTILGAPRRTDMNGRMLKYNDDGIDLLFSANGPLSEIHLNSAFVGKLDTGISMHSTQEDVFTAYGGPVQTIRAADLNRRNNERVLFIKNDISRIFYGKCGLIFWFKNDSVSQIVVFEGRMKNADEESATDESIDIQSWTQNGRTVDRIDYPFVPDQEAIGSWTSVDFVKTIEDFDPAYKSWKGDLYLKGLILYRDGTTSGPWQWTKGIIVHPVDRTASRYLIKEYNGTKYMFFEWKSNDYSVRHEKPLLYVLKKTG